MANWTSRLLIVKLETVVDWQRRRFHYVLREAAGRHGDGGILSPESRVGYAIKGGRALP